MAFRKPEYPKQKKLNSPSRGGQRREDMDLDITLISANVVQLIKRSDLSCVLEPEVAKKTVEFVKRHGVVTPIIVAPEKGSGLYGVIKGWETLEAARGKGDTVINAVCVNNTDLGVQTEVALGMSVITEKISAVSQGKMVKRLSDDEKMTLKELSKITGKSQSWVSKKKSMVENLCEYLIEQVDKGKIAPRTAEEIAKLPKDVQTMFATNAVIKGKMSKNKISELVRMYNSKDSDEIRKKKVIERPHDVIIIEHERKKKMALDKYSETEIKIAETQECVSSVMSRIAMMSDSSKRESKIALTGLANCLKNAAAQMAGIVRSA
jgi:ParB-like chromosome segregation protein Spo0J